MIGANAGGDSKLKFLGFGEALGGQVTWMESTVIVGVRDWFRQDARIKDVD